MEKTHSKPVVHNLTHKRLVWLGEAVVSLVLANLLAARALDTGSLQQYALALVLLAVGINRVYLTLRGAKNGR
ncbi:MAG TPA: hypothetical protein VLG11_03925 [Candidatus Saccharimonadales bacterium]|nr:hypothetical protein [Candidatus Saccharimonadales bacterium]